MTTIALFAHPTLPLAEVTAALDQTHFTVIPVTLDARFELDDAQPPADKAILLTREQGIISLGEITAAVRERLAPDVLLTLCAPHPTAHDRQLLIDCGASEIITPHSWSSSHIAERILSQLIVEGDVQPDRCGALRGATQEMHDLYEHMAKMAPLSEPILIIGETGTGKELVARELHNLSRRPDTCIPVNCPEISPDLLSSELFGHERGAFTGADRSRVGLIAAAGKGTVFLDEIGDIDLQGQAKLLRLIEDRKVRRVGSNHLEDVCARIILATNKDLYNACSEGRFRRDLLERIRGFTLEVPPLRERRADIPLLAQSFVDSYAEEYRMNLTIPGGSLDCLFHHHWPGNVRELRAVIRKAAAYADSAGNISPVILQESVLGHEPEMVGHVIPFNPSADTWRSLLSRAKEIYFRTVLAQVGGNREAAIKLSGLSRSQFFENIKELSKDDRDV